MRLMALNSTSSSLFQRIKRAWQDTGLELCHSLSMNSKFQNIPGSHREVILTLKDQWITKKGRSSRKISTRPIGIWLSKCIKNKATRSLVFWPKRSWCSFSTTRSWARVISWRGPINSTRWRRRGNSKNNWMLITRSSQSARSNPRHIQAKWCLTAACMSLSRKSGASTNFYQIRRDTRSTHLWGALRWQNKSTSKSIKIWKKRQKLMSYQNRL